MKMEGVSELANERNEAAIKQHQPSPKEIGREFVRQYYTMLSERPQDVFRFYSHESYFAHDTDQPIQGQQKIQKAIERLSFVDCKARIYTVSGTATMNSGLVIQVCGELTIRHNPGRRFLQTFILCPQTPKKYYVHNDVFQWLDRAFGDSLTSTPTSEIPKGDADNEDALNGNSRTLNGHRCIQQETEVSYAQSAPSVPLEKARLVGNAKEIYAVEKGVMSMGIASDATEPLANCDRTQTITDEVSDESSERTQSEPLVDETVTVIDKTPKTWAKMVGGNTQPGASGDSISTPSITSTTTRTTSAKLSSTNTGVGGGSPSNANSNTASGGSDAETNGNVNIRSSVDDCCRLYIGGIMRNVIPVNSLVVEKELRTIFEKFGPLVSVHVPRRVLESPELSRVAYAFIVMKTPEGARNVFKAARKERNLYYLSLKLDSFGFDGEVALSEQKSSQVGMRSGPFVSRGVALPGTVQHRGGAYGGMRGGAGRLPLRHSHTRSYGGDFRPPQTHLHQQQQQHS
ncbi:hypothetical protein AB6A40_001394 [Gnathostoma spinigerum]|uniref:Uncharacterized protein n=1 Tax=Gnathostoma spinigerum TaxID=75299 RepID=A0ABD6EED7_9BILA